MLAVSLASIPAVAQTTASAAQGCDAAALYIARGDFSRALTVLSSATGGAASSADRLNLKGVAQLMSSDPGGALGTFQRAIDMQPSHPEALLNHALTLLKLRRFSESAGDMQRIYENVDSPYRSRAAYHHALADDALNERSRAVEWLKKAIALNPAYDDAILYLGLMFEKTRQFEEAGKSYQAFLVRHPHSPVAMLGFARSAQRSGFGETARRYFEKVIQEAPGTAEAIEAQKYALLWE